MSQNQITLDQFVQRAKSLYSLPAVAAKVLELTEHPKVDTTALRECIEHDPALTAKILRVVNSSQYGHAHGIRDLGQAVTVLGTKPLKMLVLGFSLPDRLFVGAGRETLLWYWQHALTKAVAAREICRMLWFKPGDEAFVAGLLADIGVLVLLQELQRDYSGFLSQVIADQGDLLDLESSALGFDHAQLGSRLLRHWGLPASLTDAIGAPRDRAILAAAPADESEMAKIIHLAELVAVVVAERRYDVLPEFLATGREYRGMKRKQAQHLVHRLDEQVTQLARILSLSVNENREYTALVTAAHQRLAEETFDLTEQVSELQDGEVGACDRLLQEASALAEAASHIVFAGQAECDLGPRDTRSQTAHTASPLAGRIAAMQTDRAAVATDSGLQGRLVAAALNCRRRRCELTLLLLEIDCYEEQLVAFGSNACDRLRSWIENTCDLLDHVEANILQVDDSRWAILISDCDRKLAVACASDILAGRERTFRFMGFGEIPLPTLSIGAATLAAVSANFAANALLDSAERCLYGASSAGGGMVKSIEIY